MERPIAGVVDPAPLLQRYQERIPSAWADAARRLPGLHYRERPDEELLAWGRRSLAALIQGLTSDSYSAVDGYLSDISLARLHQGFDIGEVVEGLLLLKEVSLSIIWDELPPSHPLARDAVARLDGCVRYMIGRFARYYAEAMGRELRAQQRELAVMEERQRLARELHDSVTQALYSITLFADAAGNLLAVGEQARAEAHLVDLRETAREALLEMRLLIFELRPPLLEKEGLAAALQARLEAVEARGGLKTSLEVEGEGRLPAATEEGLYRIAQEALNNVVKHACAREVSVRLRLGREGACLEIADDGVGFDPSSVRSPGGMGIPGMGERAAGMGGRLEMESASGRGTRVMVLLDSPVPGSWA